MRDTASSNSSADTSAPSTRLITSPGSMPAFAAGEPSIGETITKRFLRFSTSMPMPSISSFPSVSFFSFPYSSGSMKRECGSSTSVSPRAAPYMSSVSEMSST